MEPVILLMTFFEKDYWKNEKEARFTRRNINVLLPNWQTLNNNCPLPGIGIYTKGKDNNFFGEKFVYLKIKGIEADPNTNFPLFDYEFISESNCVSRDFFKKVSGYSRELFSSIDYISLKNILNSLNENPPIDWLNLIKTIPPATQTTKPATQTTKPATQTTKLATQTTKPVTQINPTVQTSNQWKFYIGSHFYKPLKNTVGNNNYEDYVKDLLVSLGFEVEQKGHKKPGAFADGIATYQDFRIVYDCKNSTNFSPSENDKRAQNQYLKDEILRCNKKNDKFFSAFIAKSFQGTHGSIKFLNYEDLLYILYKKLTLGNKFNLNPFKLLLKKDSSFSKKDIDNNW